MYGIMHLLSYINYSSSTRIILYMGLKVLCVYCLPFDMFLLTLHCLPWCTVQAYSSHPASHGAQYGRECI
jgi:hypothetical protein